MIRSEPDEIVFDKEFKDILINKENIVITESISNSPRIIIKLKDVFNKKLNFKLIGDKERIKELSYLGDKN